MKKFYFLFLLLLLPLVASAETVTIDGINYEVDPEAKTAEVTSGGDYTGSIVIPETITFKNIECKVTSIRSSAFSYCRSLTSVTIPSSVTSIGSLAFYVCSHLTSVYIPNSVTSIGGYAFSDTPWFNNKPDGVVYAGKVLYRYKGTMPEGTKISIKDGTLGIAGSAFSDCSGLTSVTIPNGVTSIGGQAFENCSSLTSVYIPNSVTSIGGYAFRNCSSLTSIEIPNSVTSILSEAFIGCSSLTSVIIPNSVTSIGPDAFKDCSSLVTVTLGTSINYIGSCAFANCGQLTDFYCFAENLPECYYQSNKSPYGYNSFSNSYINYATLHVPKGSVNDYKTTEPWSNFKDVIAIDSESSEYTLSYVVDGNEYKSYKVEEGAAITPEPAPIKEGYVFSGWSTIPETMPAEDVTITGSFQLITDEDVITLKETGKGTWCSDYDLDFTDVEGIKAYTATGYDDIDKTVWLTRVFRVPAGTGIMVKGNPGEHVIPHAKVKSVYANFFKGIVGTAVTINETDGDNTNYYMAGGQFKKVNGSTTISPNRAYLQLPTLVFAGTRSIEVIYGDEEDDLTGIHSATTTNEQEPGIFYNLQGQRVDNPRKGLYIKNGRKVVIK